jgi:manganese-dependent inorganic pyrophosphatase
MNYVFPYINPDTDGVCAAVAFSILNNEFKPVIFGDFDKETTFVFSLFQLQLPDKISEIEESANIALVDTHHLSQIPKINLKKVVEIIDHHPAGDAHMMPNAKIQNEEVGAACTLIAERMKNKNIIPNKEIAGILCMAIISNTLNFTAPSTSPRDQIALDWLKSFVQITEENIVSMFQARSDISNFETSDLLLNNTKVFEINDKKIGITQLELVGIENLIHRSDFLDSYSKIQIVKPMDFFIFTVVDIINHTTTIMVLDKKTKIVVENTINIQMKPYKSGFKACVNKILLRKTDFVPTLKNYFS